MHWADIPFHPPRKTLRQFSGLWMLFFGGLAAWQYLARGNVTLAIVFAALAATIGPLGLVRPETIRPIFVGWMIAAFPIGWVVSHVILAAMFYGVFTPVALVFRLAGRDALGVRRGSGRTTYWSPKPAPVNVRNYYRQF